MRQNLHDRYAPLPFFDAITDRSKHPNKPAKEVNPGRQPTGPFTGRCSRCESNDLWDDCTTYGCNNCGAVFSN